MNCSMRMGASYWGWCAQGVSVRHDVIEKTCTLAPDRPGLLSAPQQESGGDPMDYLRKVGGVKGSPQSIPAETSVSSSTEWFWSLDLKEASGGRSAQPGESEVDLWWGAQSTRTTCREEAGNQYCDLTLLHSLKCSCASRGEPKRS